MRRFLLPLLAVLIVLGAGVTSAQDTSTATSNVTIFVVICDTRAVVNLNGAMLAGYDVYFQVYSGPGGTGAALTSLRRAAVDGTYAFSEIVDYDGDASVAATSIASLYVAIARETDSSATTYTTTVDDIQDGCADPQNPLGASNVTTGTAGAPSATTTQSPGTNSSGTSTILSPFGGVLNPNYIPPDESAVVIGAREEFVLPRQETPGLIFAECNAYPVALPGVVYDTDNVVVFWSWFARTRQQVQDHIDNVDYSITYYQVLALPNVTRSEIQQIGGNYWVFYTATLGNLRPGRYYFQYLVNWFEPITDGYTDYGPGTDTEFLNSGCGFNVIPNPQGRPVVYNPWPYNILLNPTP